ncbi:MAG: purine-nucleoside phosphorylase [Sphingobacteriales bacterium]|nr:purine-nucleoside phosphorylase [Sphingobacteriales bacterium]
MKLLQETKQFLINKGITDATVGIVLGTGLHKILDYVEVLLEIPYSDIPNFPVSTVEFHKGNLVYGKLAGKYVLIMQGRFHQYEGYSMQQIVFPVRVMKLLGIKALFLSNAAGGINLNFKKGDLVLLNDHINLQSGNPLTGKNFDELGGRFTDMSEPYSKKLSKKLKKQAKALNIKLKKGVYAAVNGPNLETRAEYRYLKVIGADLVGMSTVPEVIAANHMQLPCAAISVITDECNPDNLKPINIAEIIEIAGKADEKVALLLKETITLLNLDTANG